MKRQAKGQYKCQGLVKLRKQNYVIIYMTTVDALESTENGSQYLCM